MHKDQFISSGESAKTPVTNDDIRHEAAGNLAFLLSVIRCGEQLSPPEEENVRRVIRNLNLSQGALTPVGEALIERLQAERDEARKLLAGTIPPEVWNAITTIGEVEWGATKEQTADEHIADFKDTLRITAEHFGLPDATALHGLYLKNTTTVLCHTGISPNSPLHAKILCGLWNWLLRNCDHIQKLTEVSK